MGHRVQGTENRIRGTGHGVEGTGYGERGARDSTDSTQCTRAAGFTETLTA